MSDSLPLDGLQHARLPCPSLSPGVCSDSCPLSWWCYLIISSSAALFSFFLQSFSASQAFPMSLLFISGRQKYWSFCFSTSSSNAYSELISFRIHWLDLLAVQGTLKSHLQHHSSKASIRYSTFMVQLSHSCLTTEKTIALQRVGHDWATELNWTWLYKPLLAKWCLCFV